MNSISVYYNNKNIILRDKPGFLTRHGHTHHKGCQCLGDGLPVAAALQADLFDNVTNNALSLRIAHGSNSFADLVIFKLSGNHGNGALKRV